VIIIIMNLVKLARRPLVVLSVHVSALYCSLYSDQSTARRHSVNARDWSTVGVAN